MDESHDEKESRERTAKIVPLGGEEFSRAFAQMMVMGHTEVLQKIDGELMSKAQNEDVKRHLTETHRHIASHLEAAKKLDGGTAVGAPGPNRGSTKGQQLEAKDLQR